jgi:hypothetical protein
MIASAPETRHRLGIIGIVLPEALYTTAGVKAVLNIGEKKLVAAREAGVLKGHFHGRSTYYLGKDLIAWLTSEEHEHA